MSAVRHPLRRRILRAFLDGSVDCPSASQLAEVTNRRVGEVAYHLKALAQCDILRPVQNGGANPRKLQRGWTLGVEAEWLRVVLEVWAESGASR
ncbi:MAG TPA: helix-turn-helix domain-containing protein [Solirubrobacterales bacterium]|nr:helix-turn-helix domain-containing protein [Solirubrobacterales bacterium]